MTEKGLIDGICQKCQSSNIQKEEGVFQGPSGVFSMKNHTVTMFICGKCSYMEFYYKGKSFWK